MEKPSGRSRRSVQSLICIVPVMWPFIEPQIARTLGSCDLIAIYDINCNCRQLLKTQRSPAHSFRLAPVDAQQSTTDIDDTLQLRLIVDHQSAAQAVGTYNAKQVSN